VEVHAIDRLHMRSLAVSKTSVDGHVTLKWQEFGHIDGLCDAVVLVQMATPNERPEDGAEHHMTVELSGHQQRVAFTTRCTSQFVAHFGMRVCLPPPPPSSSSECLCYRLLANSS